MVWIGVFGVGQGRVMRQIGDTAVPRVFFCVAFFLRCSCLELLFFVLQSFAMQFLL